MSSYRVGDGINEITLVADIDTFGLAASRAIVIDTNADDPGRTVGTSVDATGDIANCDIGAAFTLAGKMLSVMTKIDLLGSDQERQREADRLNAKYILNGGADSLRIYTDAEKVVSNDVRTVILFFTLDLIRQ